MGWILHFRSTKFGLRRDQNFNLIKLNYTRMPLMKAPKDPRATRPGMGGDPWRLVSKWNLIEDYPNVGFAAFTDDKAREDTFGYLRMFQEYYHRGNLQDYSSIKEHKV